MLMIGEALSNISELEARLGCWELVDYAATLVVFFGVLGELVAEHVMKSKAAEQRKKQLSRLSTIVLLIGLAGELAALVKTSTLTTEIMSSLTTDIKSAYSQASSATDRASELARENIKLRGEFETKTGKLNLNEQILRRQNLETTGQLERERKTRLELEASLAPRTLPYKWVQGSANSGPTSNIDELLPFKGTTAELEIINDAEARRASSYLAFILQQSGWRTTEVPETGLNFAFIRWRRHRRSAAIPNRRKGRSTTRR